MQQNITTGIITIAPAMAEQMLKFNTRNRPVNQLTVDDYALQMKKGLWRLNGEPIIITEGGCILDGQHRLLACVASGQAFQSIIVRGVDGEVFSTIDTGRVRTAGDVFNINGVTNAAQKAAIITAYFNMRRNEASFDEGVRLRKIKMSKTEVLDFYSNHAKLVDRINSFSYKCYKKVRLMSYSTVGAYILLLVIDKKHPIEKAEAFFEELFQFHPETNQSVTLLHDCLIRHITKQRILSPAQRSNYVIKVWNAYVKGKELKYLSYDKAREGQLAFI